MSFFPWLHTRERAREDRPLQNQGNNRMTSSLHRQTTAEISRTANFYHRFITNYSQVTLCHQTHFSPSSFHSRAILHRTHPNTSKQFIVQMDASDTGAGAALSQSSECDGHLHLCACFSLWFSLPREIRT